MSGRAVSQPPNRRTPQIAKFFLAMGLLAGAALIGVGLTRATAQPDEPDDKSPLPPREPNRALTAQRLQIPNKDRAIFQGRRDVKGNWVPNSGIVDFEPVASEKKNSDEYQAWNEVIAHAAQFPAAELEDHAGRDLTRDDLVKLPGHFRLDLVRFDGQITKVRRFAATKALQDGGIAEVYQALVIPLDEPPTVPVSLIFTELPAVLAGVKQKAEVEWMAVDTPATAAGYFFKVEQDARTAPKDEAIPVLIGKSVTVRKEPREPSAGADRNNPTALDKNLRVFKYIHDDTRMAKEEVNWEEVSAWNRVLLHARRFSPEELEQHARADLKFADLFEDVRRDYKLDLVKFEGRLLSLKKMEPTKKLQAAGLEVSYEGWLVPKDEPRGNPICIVFTDPPDGVEPNGRVNKWVSFAGYSFKLLRYESGERDKDDPNRNVVKKAPLLVGRAIVVRPDPDGASNVSWQSFATVATAVVLGLIGTALGLSWWFRRGDRRARQEINANRPDNPFGETS
jgi:hypothetical protein